MREWTPQERAEHTRAWVADVTALVSDIAAWAASEGWLVNRLDQEHQEQGLGVYAVPHLRLATRYGEVQVDPVARDVIGADGRVDLISYSTLNRIRLVRRAGQWEAVTDANARVEPPWSKEVFLRLTKDLQAVA